VLVSQFKIQQGQGFIFCLSYVAGASVGCDSHIPYVTEKAGVIGFVHRHATELGERNIRITGATPGLIITAQPRSVEHSVGAGRLGSLAPLVPKGRIDDTEDIAM
jgi:NAD(P)-dependent dehydrogenase (short-subunit alcohol dehydrogenase family)